MATRKVGGIVAELLLNDKDFRNKLNRAGKLTESRAAKMRKAFAAIGGAALAAGAAMAAMGGVAAAGIARANTRLDQLAKTSDKLGIAPDRLQMLRAAAEQSGVSIQTLDTSLQRMVRRVAEAAQGTGEAVNALKELGISATDLAKLSPDEQMARIADQMNEVASSGDQVRLAMKLFDTEGVALVNMLRMGSGGFEELRKELERYGIALTRLDLAKVEAANDEFTRLKRIQQGFWEQLSVKAAPVLEMVGDKLLENADRFGGMDEVAEAVINNLLRGAGFVADAFWGWELAQKGAELGWLALERTAIAVSQSIVDGVENAVNKAIDAINWMIRQANRIPKVNIEGLARFEMGVANDFLSDRADSAKGRFQKARSELEELWEGDRPSERMRAKFERLHQDFERRAKELESKVGANVDEALTPLDDLGEAAEAAAEELKKLSVQDIADLDPTGSRGGLAQRILDLEEQAKREEAQGRDEAAERSRERAQELRDRLETLQQGGSQVQGDRGLQRRRDEMRERNFIGPRLPEGTEVSPESEAAPEVRSGNQVDTGGSGSENEAAILREILSAINNLPQLIGVV